MILSLLLGFGIFRYSFGGSVSYLRVFIYHPLAIESKGEVSRARQLIINATFVSIPRLEHGPRSSFNDTIELLFLSQFFLYFLHIFFKLFTQSFFYPDFWAKYTNRFSTFLESENVSGFAGNSQYIVYLCRMSVAAIIGNHFTELIIHTKASESTGVLIYFRKQYNMVARPD